MVNSGLGYYLVFFDDEHSIKNKKLKNEIGNIVFEVIKTKDKFNLIKKSENILYFIF